VAQIYFAGLETILAIILEKERAGRFGFPGEAVTSIAQNIGEADKSLFQDALVKFDGGVVGALLSESERGNDEAAYDRRADLDEAGGVIKNIGALLIGTLLTG
jgi:hypothetical protein